MEIHTWILFVSKQINVCTAETVGEGESEIANIPSSVSILIKFFGIIDLSPPVGVENVIDGKGERGFLVF